MNTSKKEIERLLATGRPIGVRLSGSSQKWFGRSGQHSTLRAGNDGVDFNSLTSYDSRTHRPSQIDWRRVARSDEVQVRQYDRTTAITLWLILDVSQSMQFGSQRCTKFGVLCEIVASLLMGAERSQERVGLVLVEDSAVHMSFPTAAAQLLIPALQGLVTGEYIAMSIVEPRAFAAQLRSSAGVIAVIVSDLQKSDQHLLFSLIPRPGATLATKAILIDDLREKELPQMPKFFGLRLPSLIVLSDSSRLVRFGLSSKTRQLYSQNFRNFELHRAERLRALGIRNVAVDTSETLSQVLTKVKQLLS